MHPELRPKGKKQRTNEVNVIEKKNDKKKIKDLHLIISKLTKRLNDKEENSDIELNLTIPRKVRFNKEDSGLLAEESAYQNKIAQSHEDEEESSSSDSTVSNQSK